MHFSRAPVVASAVIAIITVRPLTPSLSVAAKKEKGTSLAVEKEPVVRLRYGLYAGGLRVYRVGGRAKRPHLVAVRQLSLPCGNRSICVGCRASPRRLPYHSRNGALESRKIVSDKTLLLSLCYFLRKAGAVCYSLARLSLPAGGKPSGRGSHQDDDRKLRAPEGALQKQPPIGSVDPYALKIPTRRAECSVTACPRPTAPLTATGYSRCGSHWPRQSGSLSRRR